jgi:predicted ABC-type sugar transport system permease subunit
MCVYLYAGLLYGCAGVLQAGRLGLANALTANGMELDAIAAVTVGGISQNGGVGTVRGHDHRGLYHGTYQLRNELPLDRLLLSIAGERRYNNRRGLF